MEGKAEGMAVLALLPINKYLMSLVQGHEGLLNKLGDKLQHKELYFCTMKPHPQSLCVWQLVILQ
jgi:hypothetical protein